MTRFLRKMLKKNCKTLLKMSKNHFFSYLALSRLDSNSQPQTRLDSNSQPQNSNSTRTRLKFFEPIPSCMSLAFLSSFRCGIPPEFQPLSVNHNCLVCILLETSFLKGWKFARCFCTCYNLRRQLLEENVLSWNIEKCSNRKSTVKGNCSKREKKG